MRPRQVVFLRRFKFKAFLFAILCTPTRLYQRVVVIGSRQCFSPPELQNTLLIVNMSIFFRAAV